MAIPKAPTKAQAVRLARSHRSCGPLTEGGDASGQDRLCGVRHARPTSVGLLLSSEVVGWRPDSRKNVICRGAVRTPSAKA